MLRHSSLSCPLNNGPLLSFCSHDILPPGPHHRGGGAGWEGGFLPGAGCTHHSLGRQKAPWTLDPGAQESGELNPRPHVMGLCPQKLSASLIPSSSLFYPNFRRVPPCTLYTLNKAFLLVHATADLSVTDIRSLEASGLCVSARESPKKPQEEASERRGMLGSGFYWEQK